MALLLLFIAVVVVEKKCGRKVYGT